MRTTCSSSRSSSVGSGSCLIPVPLLASSARVCTTPSAAGLTPQSHSSLQPLSFLCLFWASELLSLHLSSSLRASFRGLRGRNVFLGITHKLSLAHKYAALRRATDPPPRTAPGRQAPAAEPTPPKLVAQSAALPVRLTKAASSGLEPGGFRPGLVARFLPHPHEIPGLIPPGRRPEVRGASRPAPHDSLNRP